MEWFEQVKDTVLKTAGVAYEKSEQLVDIAKLKIAIANSDNAIDKLYKELGKLCYNESKGVEAKTLCEELIKQIDEKAEENEKLKAQLNYLRKISKCPSCNSDVSQEDAFCPKCGAKLTKAEKPLDEEEIIIE